MHKEPAGTTCNDDDDEVIAVTRGCMLPEDVQNAGKITGMHCQHPVSPTAVQHTYLLPPLVGMPSDEPLLLLLLLLLLSPPHSVSLSEADREFLPGPCCLLGRLAKGFASNVVRLPFDR
jgi:hypothetical protein